MTDKIPNDVVTLAGAYGLHIRALGKYWGLATTITVLAFTASTEPGPVELFGFKLDTLYFYPMCAVFGAILNFAYCISHLQAYRAGEIFRDYLSSIQAGTVSISTNVSVLDAAHLLYPSAVNRVYPVFHFLPLAANSRIVQALKLPVDLFVFVLPIAGCVYAATKLHLGLLSFSIWFLVAISTLMSVILVFTGVRWLFATRQAV